MKLSRAITNDRLKWLGSSVDEEWCVDSNYDFPQPTWLRTKVIEPLKRARRGHEKKFKETKTFTGGSRGILLIIAMKRILHSCSSGGLKLLWVVSSSSSRTSDRKFQKKFPTKQRTKFAPTNLHVDDATWFVTSSEIIPHRETQNSVMEKKKRKYLLPGLPRICLSTSLWSCFNFSASSSISRTLALIASNSLK